MTEVIPTTPCGVQADHELLDDGEVGPKTWRTLLGLRQQ